MRDRASSILIVVRTVFDGRPCETRIKNSRLEPRLVTRAAARSVARAVDDAFQQAIELLPVCLVESRQYLVINGRGGGLGLLKVVTASRGESYRVSAAVVSVALPLYQSAPLQFIEQIHHNRLVHVQQRTDLSLTEGFDRGQKREYSQMPHVDVEGFECFVGQFPKRLMRPLKQEAGLARERVVLRGVS